VSGSSENPRVALVTGSARGLGLAVARAMRTRGDRVHVVYRSSRAEPPDLEREFAGRLHRADLTVEAEAARLVRAVVEQDRRLDCVVHAVGEYVSGPLEQASAADLARMLRSNVESAFHLMNAARPELRSARGQALFFGCAGLEGLRARRETAVYAASKSALLVLVRAWALEEALFGVRVNMLSPGLVPHAHAAGDTLDPDRQARIPLGRAGKPEDIASAALFLCSDAASHVTGVDLEVAGGWML
jgi:NAD(P)-dependent dehydrogenase (short-subunit alcohol dehydrogenase family)